tara:strand:- start:6375 stop:7541 length:1167 start_codon:yes stop_codon:yes gene_type:complete
MNNLLITMSGGTTSVINSTLSGLISRAQKSNLIDRIYVGFPGIEGFLSDNVLNLTNLNCRELFVLKRSPGSASIGTTRAKIFDDKTLDFLSEKFEEYQIKYFVNIGGNGTIKQSKLISSKIDNVSVAAAPKTVDNDLGDGEFELLWYTPGFPSCVNYWYHKMLMINNENYGAHSHDKIIVSQTFGRETGFLVGSMRMFDVNRKTPLLLLIPEDNQSPQKVLDAVDNKLSEHGRVLIGICEGYDVGQYDSRFDHTGQKMYGSSSSTSMQEMINLLNDNGMQSRGYNPTVDQRQNFEYTLDSDIEISYQIGEKIIENFEGGNENFFQSYSRSRFVSIPIYKINNFSRKMKDEWIDHGGFDVTDEYIKYLKEFVNVSKPKELFLGGKLYEV